MPITLTINNVTYKRSIHKPSWTSLVAYVVASRSIVINIRLMVTHSCWNFDTGILSFIYLCGPSRIYYMFTIFTMEYIVWPYLWALPPSHTIFYHWIKSRIILSAIGNCESYRLSLMFQLSITYIDYGKLCGFCISVIPTLF